MAWPLQITVVLKYCSKKSIGYQGNKKQKKFVRLSNQKNGSNAKQQNRDGRVGRFIKTLVESGL
jgi:hypothetical protein